MQSAIRLLSLAVSVLALGIISLGPWGVVAPEVSANEGQLSYWEPTPGAETACDFLEMPWESDIDYICADWIIENETLVTCCIDYDVLPDRNLGDCHTEMYMPTTDDRPGL